MIRLTTRAGRRADRVRTTLAATEMFADCTERDLAAISSAATTVDVADGTVLTTEGRAGHEFAIVLEGVAVVDRAGRTVATLGAGDCFGELALLDGGPRTATITAATPMTLAVIGRPEFAALVDRSPGLNRALLITLARRARESFTEV